MYYCFGCQAGGNSISFLMEHNKASFPEAVQQLAERAGIELPAEEEDGEVLERRKVRERDLRILNWAAEVFHRQLKNEHLGRDARAYIARRGLSEQIVDELKLGLSLPGSALLTRANKEGIETEEMVRVGLAGVSDKGPYDRFRHRLMFPIRDRRGRVIAFGGRILDSGQPKYLNSPESPLFHKSRELYGLDRAGKAISTMGLAVVVEGYMDAIAAWQQGIDYVVASLGTALSEQHATILRRYSGRVTICYDADMAGQAATLRSLDILKGAGLEVRVATLEEGLDPDDVLRRKGKEHFLGLVDAQAIPLVEYKLARFAGDVDLTTPAGLGKFTREAATVLAQVENEVERQAYIVKAISLYGLPEGPFLAEVRKSLRRSPFTDKVTNTRHNTFDRHPLQTSMGWLKAGRVLLRLMAEDKGRRGAIYAAWKDMGFAEPKHRDLAAWLAEDLDEEADPAGTSHELSKELQSELAAVFSQEILEENSTRVANECFIKLEEHNLEILSQQLMKDAESAGDQELRRNILQQLQEVTNRRKRLRERLVPSRGGISLE
jgi:DNA primase